MHDALTIAIPTFAVLLGILWNRNEIQELSAEVKGLRTDMRAEFRDVRTEITGLRGEVHKEFEHFFEWLGRHDAEIDNLKKQSLPIAGE